MRGLSDISDSKVWKCTSCGAYDSKIMGLWDTTKGYVKFWYVCKFCAFIKREIMVPIDRNFHWTFPFDLNSLLPHWSANWKSNDACW